MDVFTDTSDAGVMPDMQKELFFKEASDAIYRAKSNLTPDQQVKDDYALIFFKMTLLSSLTCKNTPRALPGY